jgi:hypothetical protein
MTRAKTDRTMLLIRGWHLQCPNCIEYAAESAVEPRFELSYALDEISVLPVDPPQSHESSHDLDVDGYRARAPQHARQHRDALLCEGARCGPTSTAAAGL